MARARQRRGSRRAIETSRRASAEARVIEHAAAPERSKPAARSTTARRGAAPRATGLPSPALERAAAIERGYVVKDFRRLSVTVVAVLVLLGLAGLAENALLR